MPDVFGFSIIQGRQQDMNGIPLDGNSETPFTGTNELVKRYEAQVTEQPAAAPKKPAKAVDPA